MHQHLHSAQSHPVLWTRLLPIRQRTRSRLPQVDSRLPQVNSHLPQVDSCLPQVPIPFATKLQPSFRAVSTVEIHLRRQKQDRLEMSSVATIGSVNVEVKKCLKPPPLEPSVGVRVHCPLHLLPHSCGLPPLSCHTSSRSPAKVQYPD